MRLEEHRSYCATMVAFATAWAIAWAAVPATTSAAVWVVHTFEWDISKPLAATASMADPLGNSPSEAARASIGPS